MMTFHVFTEHRHNTGGFTRRSLVNKTTVTMAENENCVPPWTWTVVVQ